MKVKLLKDLQRPGFNLTVGSTVNLPEALAKDLVKAGDAENIKGKSVKPKKYNE